MVFHPSWGYFAKEYELEQVPIEIEGKAPKPAQLTTLIRHAREHGIRVVFVQPQFSAKSAEMISREIGGHVVHVDPLAENWAGNLREVARKFITAVR
jgi:zinc transport system substrate-binding protein